MLDIRHSRILISLVLLFSSASMPVIGGSVTESCIGAPTNLVSWWPGEGNANDIVSTNHGILQNGTTFVSGNVGQAFNFDGADDYVRIGNPGNLKTFSEITLAAWIKPTVAPSPDNYNLSGIYSIITKWGQSSASDAYGIWLHNPDGNTRLMGAVGVPGKSDPGLRGGGIIAIGQWSHVAMTYDASTGLNRLYVNGAKVAERVWTGGITLSELNVLIGKEDSFYPRFFKGAVDEVQVFSRALSANEITAIYSAGTAGLCKCEVPFFWQRDPNGINGHPLRGTCGANYDTLGEGGCTLTSATMLFRHYGASTTTCNTEMTPPNLSDCMNTKACPFDWVRGAADSNGKASNPRRDTSFNYARLDQELNQNHRPVMLQMCRPKGDCNGIWEGEEDDDITHWVLVVGGQGTDPTNYTIWDPWFECGQNMRLSSRSDTRDFVGMAVYDGTPTCSFSTEVPLCARSVSPVGLPSGATATIVEQNTATPVDLTASSIVSGTAVLYRATNITMTVHLTAQSSVGNVTDMLIWSDTISNTTWQPFAPYIWLPLSDFVYAQFRDNMGNISAVVSDTPNPSAPPVAPDPNRVYLPLVTRR